MIERAKRLIVELLAETRFIDEEVAEDIVNECQNVCNSVLAGEDTEYESVSEVVQDYLFLDDSVSWIFTYDDDYLRY